MIQNGISDYRSCRSNIMCLFIASCNVPPINDGTLYATNGKVFNGPEVLHGNDVRLKCKKGHVPDEATLTCKHSTWNTIDGKFPKCNLGSFTSNFYIYFRSRNQKRYIWYQQFMYKMYALCLNLFIYRMVSNDSGEPYRLLELKVSNLC
jgi:hypothetical protein